MHYLCLILVMIQISLVQNKKIIQKDTQNETLIVNGTIQALAKKVDNLGMPLSTKIDNLGTKIDLHTQAINSNFKLLEEKLDNQKRSFDQHFANADKRFDNVDKRFDNIDKKFDNIHKRFDSVNSKLDWIIAKLNKTTATEMNNKTLPTSPNQVSEKTSN